MTRILHDLLGTNWLVSRLIVLLLAYATLALIPEPEKIVYLSYFTVCIVVGLGSLASPVLISGVLGFWQFASSGVDPGLGDSSAFRLARLSASCGYVIASMEMINNVLNSRPL